MTCVASVVVVMNTLDLQLLLLYYIIVYNTVADIKCSFCALLQACRVAVLATETANLTTFDLSF